MKLSNRLLPFTLFNDREVSCTTLTVFLIVAEHEELGGIAQADLTKHISISKAAVTRNCRLLAGKTEKGKGGMHLIKQETHPFNASAAWLSLTEDGRRMYNQLTDGLQ